MPDTPVAWDRALCPACHHPDHDPGSCPDCPRCELHTDEAFDWVMRIEPELMLAHIDALTAAVRALTITDEPSDPITGAQDTGHNRAIAAVLAILGEPHDD